jgi:hypothetical protein
MFPGLSSALMTPLPQPSVSPLPSFCTVRHDAVPRYVSFSETVAMIWRHLRGVQPTQRERQLEAAVVKRLAAEMDEAEPPALADDEYSSSSRNNTSSNNLD